MLGGGASTNGEAELEVAPVRACSCSRVWAAAAAPGHEYGGSPTQTQPPGPFKFMVSSPPLFQLL